MDDTARFLVVKGDKLPTAGKLAITITEREGGVTVECWFSDNIAGEFDEVLPGDQVTFIAGERIGYVKDVRLTMLDRLPGAQVCIELERTTGGDKQVRVTTVIGLI